MPFGGDAVGAKERPAAIVGWSEFGPDDDHAILIVPISTFGGDSSKARTGDVPVSNYVSSRVSSNSFIRTRRLMALSPRAFQFAKGPVGMLEPADMGCVLTEMQRLVSGSTSIVVP